MTASQVFGSDWSVEMVGFSVVDNGDGTVTITKSGTDRDPAFDAWFSEQMMAERWPVQTLVKDWTLGRTGRDGQRRRVTRTSLTFNPSTLTYQQVTLVPLGPSDANPVDAVTEVA